MGLSFEGSSHKAARFLILLEDRVSGASLSKSDSVASCRIGMVIAYHHNIFNESTIHGTAITR